MHRDNPNPELLKWCTLGQHWAEKTNFYSNRSRADNLANYCIDCSSERSVQYHHNIRRLQRFGVTGEEYDKMYEEQQGCCATCGMRCDTLCLDHDHDTGQKRKLLCPKCNQALGLVNEDPSILKTMLLYLSEFGIV